MKLSWFKTSEAHKRYQAYIRYEQYDAMQDIKERELRDSGSIANTKIYFEVRATALCLRLHTEGFPLYRPHREPPLRIWVIQTWSTQLLSQSTTTITSTLREIGT